MTSKSYTRWGACVNSAPSKIPNVIRKQRSLSYDRIFRYLYRHSDAHGRFELRADTVVAETGYSRKTVYKVVKFLQRVNLLFRTESRTGRGHHSTYRLNWRKPPAGRDSSAESQAQKCHPPKNPRSNNPQHRYAEAPAPERPRWEANPAQRCRYLTSGWTTLRKGQYGFKRAAKLFRLGCWNLGVPAEPAERISGLILQRLEGGSAQRVRQVHDRLFSRLWKRRDKLQALLRRGVERLCSWVGWLLQRVMSNLEDEEAAEQRELAAWAEAERREEAWLAALKHSSLARRRRHCRESLRLFVIAWEELHERRIPHAEVEARCAALAAEYGVPAAEIRAGVDWMAMSTASLMEPASPEAGQ